jgi:lipid-A-disaccharide synthase
MLVCGEPSGDQLGAQLMRGLKALQPDIEITGVGGPAMAREGLDSLFSLDATAVMGLREVVPAIPRILARVREATDFALKTRPDAVVLIDSPDFTHRIAHAIKKRDPSIRTVNYVAPQVWASRSYRTRQMAKDFDLVLALFPFEVPFLKRYGLNAVFVGHPVIERQARMVGGAALRARLGIDDAAPLLALLPGSRSNEIRFILPVFRETITLLSQRIPGLATVLPTIPHVAAKVAAATEDWPTPLHILHSEDDKFAAFDAADVALAASGTVTAELALSKTPMVVGYRVGGLTYALSSLIMNVKFITLINILLDREAVPEFLQACLQPPLLADAVEKLLNDPAVRAEQIASLRQFDELLGEGTEAPSLRAARALLDFLG